ncbi:MAG: phenol hydroxylase [Gammaproteobacteria bacterium]|nr:phenol hydroxylase [Gammaproteobacteria bacterium]
MSIDLKTTQIAQKRITFDNVAAKLGEGKVPSRYQEVMVRMQPEEVFHYRPTWDPQHEIFDADRTAVIMQDFDDLTDPRQYYYAPYVIQRSKQQETMEKNFSMVEKRGLLTGLDDALIDRIRRVVVPFRHVEWGANTNNLFIAAYGFGTPMPIAADFQGMDRLGIAQYLTRIGLILSGNDPEILDRAKSEWLDDPLWQPLRKLIEDSFVLKDWFELHLLQNFLLDGVLHPLLFEHFDAEVVNNGGAAFAMLTEFFVEWYGEAVRWTDHTLKTAAAESAQNKALLSSWKEQWLPQVSNAALPLAEYIFADRSADVMSGIVSQLEARADKMGLG